MQCRKWGDQPRGCVGVQGSDGLADWGWGDIDGAGKVFGALLGGEFHQRLSRLLAGATRWVEIEFI